MVPAKVLAVSNYIWTPNYWFVNKARYEGLPMDQRNAISQAVIHTTIWYREQLDGVIADTVEKLKAKKVTVTQVDGRALPRHGWTSLRHFRQRVGCHWSQVRKEQDAT